MNLDEITLDLIGRSHAYYINVHYDTKYLTISEIISPTSLIKQKDKLYFWCDLVGYVDDVEITRLSNVLMEIIMLDDDIDYFNIINIDIANEFIGDYFIENDNLNIIELVQSCQILSNMRSSDNERLFCTITNEYVDWSFHIELMFSYFNTSNVRLMRVREYHITMTDREIAKYKNSTVVLEK